jgi:hypothetical protein
MPRGFYSRYRTKGALDFEQKLKDAGLVEFAGGDRFTYFTLPGCNDGKLGVGWRVGPRAVRLVQRKHLARGIVDAPLGNEHYYGKLKANAAEVAAKIIADRCKR